MVLEMVVRVWRGWEVDEDDVGRGARCRYSFFLMADCLIIDLVLLPVSSAFSRPSA